MSRAIGEIFRQRGAALQTVGDSLIDNPFNRARANHNLFELGRRLREQDDLADMPTFKRRRLARRRPRRTRRAFRRTSYATSSKGNVSRFGYSSKRFNLRRFKRQLWNSTAFMDKHRVARTVEFNISPTNVGTTATCDIQELIPDNWWTVGAGLQDTAIFRTENRYTIRGGLSKLMMHNDMTEPVLVTVYTIWAKSGTITIPTAPTEAWDPTLMPEHGSQFKLVGQKHFNLSQDQTITMLRKIPLQTGKFDEWNDDNHMKPYWIIKTYNPSGTIGGTIRCHVSYNFSFCADEG